MFPAQALDCVIPVVEISDNAPSYLTSETTSALQSAIEFWNSQGLNFRLELISQSEMKTSWGSITVSWVPGEELVGLTRRITGSFSEVNPKMNMTTGAHISLYSDKFWCNEGIDTGCFRLKEVITHELGHAIGLGHNESKDSVMYPEAGMYHPLSLSLTQGDHAEIENLFPDLGTRCLSSDNTALWNFDRVLPM